MSIPTGVTASISASIPSPKLVAVGGKSDINEGHKRQASGMGSNVDETSVASGNTEQPPKKKRRVALTRVADLDS
jgi:chromatin assembly factor 1 subunit B